MIKKTVLITGVNGFIGSSLRSYLIENCKAWRVIGLDVKVKKGEKDMYSCDIQNAKKLKSLLLKIRPDIIFHLAGGRVKNEKKLLQDNLLTSKTLFDTVMDVAKFSPRIIVPGTAAEYGEVPRDSKSIKETYEEKPAGWYGFVKLIQTNLGLVYARKGCDIVIARMFNIGGKGTPVSLVAGRFAHDVISASKRRWRRAIQTGNLSGVRDFLDINDVCCALVLLSQKGKSGQIYNICSGKAVRIKDLLTRTLKIAKAKNVRVQKSNKHNSDSYSIVGSNAKLKKCTGWKQRVSLDKSIEHTIQYYQK